MAMEMEERGAELESALYSNGRLLGLDPAILGGSVGGNRVGRFRHSNPRMGEQVLYFLLSALRDPVQSAKDFDKQELKKLQEMRNKAKLEAELWDDRISSSSAPSSHIVSKATCLWESLLAHKSQHEVLASGPIEDLIAHREHRCRISGSSLIAAMDLSSRVPYSDVFSARAGEISPPINNREQAVLPRFKGVKIMMPCLEQKIEMEEFTPLLM